MERDEYIEQLAELFAVAIDNALAPASAGLS